MAEFTRFAAEWGLHAAAAGVVVFALGWACVRRVRDPARRHALGGWVVRGGLLAAVLCALPAWLVLPVPLPLWPAEPVAPQTVPQPMPDQSPIAHDPRPVFEPTDDAVSPVRAEVTDGRWVMLARPAVPTFPVALPPWPAVDAVAAAPPAGINVERCESPAKTQTTRFTAVTSPGAASSTCAPATPSNPWAGIVPLVVSAYAVAVAVAGFPLVLGVVALARLRKSGKPAPAGVQWVFDELAAGMHRRPTLLVSERVASPICFGLLRPVVMLPRTLALAATETELRWVFAHELDHLRRGDPWTGWWVGVARAVYFFVPWVGRLKRDLGLVQEYLADAAAAAAAGRAEDYAAFLVKLSGGPGNRRTPVGVAGVRARKSDLFRRVTMLLSVTEKTRRASRGWNVLAGAGVLGLVVAVSGIGFARPTGDDTQPPAKPTKPDGEKVKDKVKEPKAKPAAGDDTQPPAKADDKPAGKPGDVVVGPPAELEALRKAVEAAARKGENVDDIRKQLDALEKALTGKTWTRPKMSELPPAPPAPVQPVPGLPAFPNPPAVPAVPGLPAFPNQPFMVPRVGGGIDQDAIQKAQDLIMKAADLLAKNPTDAEAAKLMKQAEELMGKAFQGGIVRGFANDLPGFAIPGAFAGNVPAFGGGPAMVDPRGGVVRAGGRAAEGRLGLGVEKVPAVVLDQLDLPKNGGLVVTDVVKGQPAEKAGLKANDILIEVGGKAVPADVAEFGRLVNGFPKGEKVDVTFIRKGKKDTAKGVELGEARRGAGAFPELPGVEAVPGVPLRPLPPPPVIVPDGRLLDNRPAVPAGRGAAAVAGGRAGDNTNLSVSVEDGVFTLKAEQNGVKYLIEGEAADGKAVPSKITVIDGEKKVEAATIDKLPADYRDRVKAILARVRVQ